MNELDEIAKYFFKLTKKKKIVWVREVYRDPKTPKFVRDKLLTGNTQSLFNNFHMRKHKLVCVTTNLGYGNSSSVLVFHEKNLNYFLDAAKSRDNILKKKRDLELKVRKLEQELNSLGRG